MPLCIDYAIKNLIPEISLDIPSCQKSKVQFQSCDYLHYSYTDIQIVLNQQVFILEQSSSAHFKLCSSVQQYVIVFTVDT